MDERNEMRSSQEEPVRREEDLPRQFREDGTDEVSFNVPRD